MANALSGYDSLAKLRLLVAAVGVAALGGIAAAQDGGASATPAQGGARANATAELSCVSRPNVRRMQIVDSQNILFVMRDKTTYRNSLLKECPGLRRNSQISLTASDRQVCAGASFQVLLRVGSGSNSESVLLPGGQTMSVPRPSFVPGPTCNLGAFAAVTQADVDALVESARTRGKGERQRDDEAAAPATPEAR